MVQAIDLPMLTSRMLCFISAKHMRKAFTDLEYTVRIGTWYVSDERADSVGLQPPELIFFSRAVQYLSF